MSKKFSLELNDEGFRTLFRSAEMKELLLELANGVQRKAGDGYEVTLYTGPVRANASIITTTAEAMQDNLDNNTLLKALDASRH